MLFLVADAVPFSLKALAAFCCSILVMLSPPWVIKFLLQFFKKNGNIKIRNKPRLGSEASGGSTMTCPLK